MREKSIKGYKAQRGVPWRLESALRKHWYVSASCSYPFYGIHQWSLLGRWCSPVDQVLSQWMFKGKPCGTCCLWKGSFPEVSTCLSFCRPWASSSGWKEELQDSLASCVRWWNMLPLLEHPLGNFLLFLKKISKLLPSPCQTKPICEDFKVGRTRSWMLQDLNPSVPKGNLWKCGSHLLPHFLMSSSQTVQGCSLLVSRACRCWCKIAASSMLQVSLSQSPLAAFQTLHTSWLLRKTPSPLLPSTAAS